ncbi:MAG TPA: class I adenylate-forming enzyme family protein [Opitutaceae bacterium]|nr:class I adenylate-forming enzyme family protein [Opitutaceae bacterium]
MSHTLLARWGSTLERSGSQRALIHASTQETISFSELDHRAKAWSDQWSKELATLSGKAVIFAVANSSLWFEISLSLFRAGAIAVPVDSAEPLSAQRELASALRAGALWEGDRLVLLDEKNSPRRFRHPGTSLIKLTSGSTGQPRPLIFTDQQLIADAEQVMSTMGIASQDLNYALIPFGHSYGLGNLSLPLLIAGVPVVCGTAALPRAIADDFARWKPTVFAGVPALFRALASSTDLRLDSLRLAISAGAPLSPEIATAFHHQFGRRIHSFYGSSETGGITFDRDGDGALHGTVGTALDGVRLTLLSGQRLQVSSAAVVTQGNRRRHQGEGAWVMADRVTQDVAGKLTLLGRRGSTVKIAGRRLELAEVSARLKKVPGVSEVWVGVSGTADNTLGAAVVSDRPVNELRRDLLALLPAWKVPRKWLRLENFPLTQRGKLDTATLRAALFPPATDGANSVR